MFEQGVVARESHTLSVANVLGNGVVDVPENEQCCALSGSMFAFSDKASQQLTQVPHVFGNVQRVVKLRLDSGGIQRGVQFRVVFK